MFLDNFWLFLLFFFALWYFLWVSGSMGQFSRVLTSGAGEALWCFLWVSMAHCACTALLLSGAFLCLLLLLCVLLLLLVLLPLVGTVGPLQLHPSTTFNNVRASRSLLRQVLVDSDGLWWILVDSDGF